MGADGIRPGGSQFQPVLTVRRIVNISILAIGMTFMLSSCFKEDERIPPHDPGDVTIDTIVMTNNYRYQVYYDLGTESVVATNEKKTWDLGFECGPDGWHIILNTSNFMLAAKTGHLGPTVYASADGGCSWQEAAQPPAFPPAPEGQEGLHAFLEKRKPSWQEQ